MAADYLFGLYAAAGVGSVVAVGFAFPALTDSAPASGSSAAQEREAIYIQEHTYCAANIRGVNCVCFARTAGYILRNDQPRLRGFAYEDQVFLARAQATQSC